MKIGDLVKLKDRTNLFNNKFYGIILEVIDADSYPIYSVGCIHNKKVFINQIRPCDLELISEARDD
jgi:hypothetical protein